MQNIIKTVVRAVILWIERVRLANDKINNN